MSGEQAEGFLTTEGTEDHRETGDLYMSIWLTHSPSYDFAPGAQSLILGQDNNKKLGSSLTHMTALRLEP